MLHLFELDEHLAHDSAISDIVTFFNAPPYENHWRFHYHVVKYNKPPMCSP